ncbi:MAG: hypothetical protein CMG85_23565 [Marinobacter sp.]|nr:hypothetical protein [Marinobacter sp.]
MKKTLANRRMFRQGGAVNSGPTGILASSPSLIDAVAQDAMNVQGGPTVRMAEGGIVRLPSPGTSRGRFPVDSLTPNIMPGTGDDLVLKFGINPNFANRKGIPVLENLIDPRKALKIPATVMAAVGSRDVGDDDTVSERYMRLFPESLEPGGADQALTQAGQPVSRMDEFLYGIKSGTTQTARNLGQSINALTDVLTRKAPAGQERSTFTSDLFQTRAVMEMKERRPDLAPEIDNLVADILKENPEISADALKNTVAYGLEKELIDKAAKFLEADPTTMDEGDTEDSPAVDAMRIDPEKAENVYGRDLGQDDTLGEEDESDPTGKAQRAEAQGRDADTSPLVKQGRLAGIIPPRKPDANIAGGSQNEIEALGTPADAKDAAEQVKQTFDKPDMKPEETKRGMEYYLDQFKGAVPKYEGMSESEKGMLIAEAGLRVMAGQSPQAIENIAKGLQGVSKEFIADKKAKRAYDQQISLSAAKYALQAVRKDEEREAALAKEGRGLKTVVWTEDVMGPDGKLRGKKGTAGFITNDEIHSGLFDGQFEAGVTLAQERLKNQGKKADSILRKMIGQTKKGGQSDKFLNDSLKEYRTSSLKLSDLATQLALVDSSLKISQDGKVTGLGAYVNRKINGLYNAFNVGRGENDPKVNSLKNATDSDIDALDTTDARKQRLKSIKRGYSTLDRLAQEGRDSQQFFAQQQELANLLIKEILGEGSKNISNIDRDLAQEIVGLYSDFGSITADPTIIAQRLGRVRQKIIKNYETETDVMRGIEDQFNTSIDRDMRNVRETYFLPIRRSALRQVSASLGTPTRQKPAVGPQGQKLYSFSVENGKRVYRFN